MSMSEKVKLPLEVAEALEYAQRELCWGIGNILTKTARRDWESVRMHPLNNAKDEFVELVANALVNGYEVEKPEEKIWDFYHTKAACEMHPHHAIQHVLNILNIKIEGVNA